MTTEHPEAGVSGVKETAGEPARSDPDLKILLVHGIGRQAPGSHLVEAVEGVVDLLLQSRCRTEVESASLVGAANAEGPAHARVRVGDEQTWLFAEAYWADTFPTPTYRELLWWGFKVAPISAVVYAAGVAASAGRNWLTLKQPIDPSTGRSNRLWALLLIVSALVQIAVIPLLVPLLLAAMVLLLLVALIPLTVVRSAVLRVQRGLTGSLGDSYVFSRLPVRRAAILTAVRDDLHWLRNSPGDAPVVVVAHSQGAAVAYELLQREEQRVPLLLTYGSGLERLSLTSRAFTGGWRFTGCSLLALLGAGMMACYTTGLMRSIADNPGSWAACASTYVGAVVVALAVQGDGELAKKSLESPRSFIALVVLGLATLGTFTWAFLLYEGIVWWWTGGFILVAGLGLASSLAKADEHSRPEMVDRWVDFQADADPVATPVLAAARDADLGSHREVIRFTLTGSVFKDHVSYWRHPDVFTWRVIEELRRTSSADGDPIPTISDHGKEASGNRTLLACARTLALWTVLAATVAVVASRWAWFDPNARTWSDELISTISDVGAFPDFARPYAGTVVTAVVLVGGFLVSYQVVLLPWRWWNISHLAKFYGHDGKWITPAILLVIVLTMAAAGTGIGLAALPATTVLGAAGQAATLLWLATFYPEWTVIVALKHSYGSQDWAAAGRRVVWSVIFVGAAWVVAYLLLLAVSLPAQQLEIGRWKELILFASSLVLILCWVIAARNDRVRRRKIHRTQSLGRPEHSGSANEPVSPGANSPLTSSAGCS